MSIGFRVRDRFTGQIKVDGTRRLLIMAGSTIVAAGASGTIVSDVFLVGTPFCWCSVVRPDSGFSYPLAGLVPPTISFSGNVLTYNNSGGAHRLIYGSY